MLISLIIPVYNTENYISACLKSVMNQTYCNFECVIVNDNSPDRSEEILIEMLATYSGAISFHVVRHETNRGLPNSLNTGISNSNGEYLLFLDSDDTLIVDCIETMVGFLSCHKHVDMIQCGVNGDINIFKTSLMPSYSESRSMIFREFLNMHIPWTVHAKLVRRKFLEENDLFFNREILIHEDLYWSYLVCQKCKTFASSTKAVYNYNTLNPFSITKQVSVHFEKSAHYYLLILNKLLSIIDDANLADNRLFLDNLFFYLCTTIEKSQDITYSTYIDYKLCRTRFFKTAWYNRNFSEVLYLCHLYNPLRLLLRFGFYRSKMYIFEKLVRWEYEKH